MQGVKRVHRFQQGGRLRFSGSYVKRFVNVRAGRSGKTTVRLRDSLKTRWAGKWLRLMNWLKTGRAEGAKAVVIR